jgi:spore coat polysaccharide biosynthesis predicted glycosyltransferase SpsG
METVRISDCSYGKPVYQDIESMSTQPMRVVLRADAGVHQGSGHVMRCLTLAEELLARGCEVILVGSLPDLPWLQSAVATSGVRVVPADGDSLDIDGILALQPDRVVVDSYSIDAGAVSALNEALPVLAIIDGDDRGIRATWFLDQNLGADDAWPAVDRFLAGARFALVRRAVLEARRTEPWRISGPAPRILSFMGGTDPTGASARVAASMALLRRPVDLTVIAPPADHAAVAAVAPAGARVLAPTPDLPRLLAEVDIVVSAAGTSAWDVCTLGAPAVLVGVVGNQSASLAAAVARGLVLGVDAAVDGPEAVARVGGLVERLIESEPQRRGLSDAARAVFDGRGTARVADALGARSDAIS